jgi:hypothetical protein
VGSTLGALVGETAGNVDAFVRRYTANGDLRWTRQFGTSGNDLALGVAVGGPGRVYVGGLTTGKLGQSQFGGFDAYVRKYEPNGDLSWTHQFGTSGHDEVYGVATDGDAAVYLVGGTGGTLPGQTSAGGFDAFAMKLNNSGKVIWTRQFGSAGADEAFAVTVDGRGGVYVVGLTDGTLPLQTSAGDFDAFVLKFSGKGVLKWTHQFGTPEHDEANGVSPNRPPTSVFVSGSTNGTLPNQTSAGGSDAFLVEISQNDVDD